MTQITAYHVQPHALRHPPVSRPWWAGLMRAPDSGAGAGSNSR